MYQIQKKPAEISAGWNWSVTYDW